MPHRGRRAHIERFVRANLVVLPTKLIQPLLLRLALPAAMLQGPLHLAVKALHLALGLRMPDPAPVQLDTLLH